MNMSYWKHIVLCAKKDCVYNHSDREINLIGYCDLMGAVSIDQSGKCISFQYEEEKDNRK